MSESPYPDDPLVSPADGWASADPLDVDGQSVKARMVSMLNAVRTILRCKLWICMCERC